MMTITKLFIGFLVFLGWAGFARQHFVCGLRGACDETAVVSQKNDSEKNVNDAKSPSTNSNAEAVNKQKADSASLANKNSTSTTDTSQKVTPPPETFFNKNFSNLRFGNKSATLQPTQKFLNYVEELSTFLTKNPNHTIKITGHTDADGEENANEQLGLNRAKSVAQYLKNKGIKVVIETASEGERNPIASNDTMEGKQRNRRVNIQVIKNN